MKASLAVAAGSLLCAIALAACDNAQPPPIDLKAIGQVQGEIKRQIGTYMRAAREVPVVMKVGDDSVDIRQQENLFWCGSGRIDYDITAVKAELTSSLTNTVGVTATISPTMVASPSANFSFSHSAANSQVLDYNLWPIDISEQRTEFSSLPNPDADELKASPIAAVLLSLRQAQILGATVTDYSTGKKRWPQPCFSNYDPAKPATDSGKSFTVGLTVTQNAQGGISVGIAAVKAGVSGGSISTTGHSLKVTFVQRGLARLQVVRDNVDVICKAPNGLSKACLAAIAAYDKLRLTGHVDDDIIKSGILPAEAIAPDKKSLTPVGKDLAGKIGGMGIQEISKPVY